MAAILEENRLDGWAGSQPGTQRSQSVASLVSQRDIGSKYLLKRGVPRAKTPAEKFYLPNQLRGKLPMAIPLLEKKQPPGVQRMGQQRGAGEQGAMRIGRSCINFDPCGTTEDHTMSVEQRCFDRRALGMPPSRHSMRGKVVQQFDGTFTRQRPLPKQPKAH